MTESDIIEINCPECGTINKIKLYTIVDAVENPELRIQIIKDEFNIFGCENCDYQGRAEIPVKYIDPENLFVLLYVKEEKYLKLWIELERKKAYEREYKESENYLKRPVGISDWEEFKETIPLNENLNLDNLKRMFKEFCDKDDIEFFEFIRGQKKLTNHSELLFFIDRELFRHGTKDKIQDKVREEILGSLKGKDAEKSIKNLFGTINKIEEKYSLGNTKAKLKK